MQDKDLIRQWIRDKLLGLPITHEVFFKKAWKEGRLKIYQQDTKIDRVDEINAQLICTAAEKKLPFLIVMPDSLDHRGPIAFSTLLIRLSLTSIQNKLQKVNILYVGKSAKFKYLLHSIYFDDLALSDAFPYAKETQTGKKKENSVNAQYLPKIICVYNKELTLEYIKKYNSKFIAIDFSNELENSWVEKVIKFCIDKNIQLTGWTTNYFTSLPKIFEANNGSVLYYPQTKGTNRLTINEIFLEEATETISSVIISGNAPNKIDQLLLDSKKILCKIKCDTHEKVKHDAIHICWNFLKVLQNMCIPIEIYNAEANSFWNVTPLHDLGASLDKYIQVVHKFDSDAAYQLQDVKDKILAIIDFFKIYDPPYWHILLDLCLQKPEENDIHRVIILPRLSQKRLFSYCLLSRTNISEEEILKSSKTFIITWKEFADRVRTDLAELKLSLFVLGLPDQFQKNFLFQFLHYHPKIIIYKSQQGLLSRIIDEFNSVEKDHLRKNIKTIKRLSSDRSEVPIPSKIKRVILSTLTEQFEILENKSVRKSSNTNSLVSIGSFDDELMNLLKNKQIEDLDEELVKYNSHHKVNQASSFVLVAIELELENDYRILFAKDEQVYVINRNKIDYVYVRAVKKGMRLLLVDNNAKKNLYDLIISRVHNHPSMEINMAILKRWKEELLLHFMIWKENSKHATINQLHNLLRLKGSKITHPETVSYWFNGTTLRPIDENDIRRLGEILDCKFISDNYKRIANAASRIVGIHIKLSVKLNDWLTNNMDLEKQDMELLDQDLKLTFGEIRESIKVLNVINMREIQGEFSPDQLSTLHKPKEVLL